MTLIVVGELHAIISTTSGFCYMILTMVEELYTIISTTLEHPTLRKTKSADSIDNAMYSLGPHRKIVERNKRFWVMCLG